MHEHRAQSAVKPEEGLSHVRHELDQRCRGQTAKAHTIRPFQPQHAEHRPEEKQHARNQRGNQKHIGDPVQILRKGSRLQIADQRNGIVALPHLPLQPRAFHGSLQRFCHASVCLPRMIHICGKTIIVIIRVIICRNSAQRKRACNQNQHACHCKNPANPIHHASPLSCKIRQFTKLVLYHIQT